MMKSTARSLIATLLVLGLSPALFALQDGGGTTPEYHQFKNNKGEFLINGYFRSSDGIKVQLLDEYGRSVEYRLSEISEEDRDWIREETRGRKLELEAQKAQIELEEFVTTGKSHLVTKGIRKLRGYGKHAFGAGQLLQNLLANSRLDVRTKHEALMAYIATTKVNRDQSLAVLRVIQGRWTECGPLIELDPVEYLTTYARFGDNAVPYLTMVAYSGELKPAIGSPIPEKPLNTELVDDTIARNRAAAAKGFAKMKNALANDMILEALSVMDLDNPTKATIDAQKMALEALADNGMLTEEVEAALKKYESKFPDAIPRLRERLEKPSSKS